MENGTLLAAIDLGSNSYRLEIGRFEDGHIRRVEYLKETVRQGGGLDETRNLTDDAMRRGWDCLARFGERLAGFKRRQVRAVATQTLREARNRDASLARAHEVLGFPIDVIAGRRPLELALEQDARELRVAHQDVVGPFQGDTAGQQTRQRFTHRHGRDGGRLLRLHGQLECLVRCAVLSPRCDETDRRLRRR